MVRVLTAIFAALVAWCSAAEAGEDSVVLDWQCSYWRYHLTFRRPKYTTPVQDRRGRTYEYLNYQRGWHIAPMRGQVYSPEAQADWMKPDFDDSSWPRERRPEAGSEGWSYDPIVQVKRLRGRFEVADPQQVTGLHLEIEYVGGVAVYLNGQEVARAHLPPGEPTAEMAAEGSPRSRWAITRLKAGKPGSSEARSSLPERRGPCWASGTDSERQAVPERATNKETQRLQVKFIMLRSPIQSCPAAVPITLAAVIR